MDPDINATQRGYAEMVINSADALLLIMNDILDSSQIEAIPFDLQALCEELCEVMAVKAHERGVELLLRFPPATPRFCIGDPGRVRQVLGSLLGNGIKFTDAGHVLLSLQCIDLGGGRLRFHVEVEDTGRGVPADQRELLFGVQGAPGTARSCGGAGLGLSLCRALTRRMGGDIGVRSIPGAGSTFWFHIVLGSDEAGASHLCEPDETALFGLRLLVVDDDRMARTMVRDQLTSCGVDVKEAESAREALALLARDASFDIAMLDSRTPQLDGADLGRRIKEDPATRDIALLMSTSFPHRGDRRCLEEIGFAGYLSKPLGHHQVRDALAVIAAARRSGGTITMVTRHSLREARAGAQRRSCEDLHFIQVRILLAEDNPMNQRVARLLLERYGCRVTTAGDGGQAVEVLRQQDFDLVFMDCQMPEMDGFVATEMIRRLEAETGRRRVPIVALTANALRGDQEICLAAGMDDYIRKPLRQGDLGCALIRWLPRGKRSDVAPAKVPRGEAVRPPPASLG